MSDPEPSGFLGSKVPAATLTFWVLKLIATTVGEVAGNLVSMSWLGETTANAGQLGVNGYLAGTAMFGAALVVSVVVQIRARRFHPWLYWTTIVASTTFGTTLADFCTRSIGIGYTGGSLLLLGLVLLSLFVWKVDAGRISADVITSRSSEVHYWVTITFSQTLGTALGDWFADTAGLGYAGSTAVFSVALAIIAALYFARAASPVLLFWSAFILSRPFGAVFGNLFDKPASHGGYGINRLLLTSLLLTLMAIGLWLLPQRAKTATVGEPAE
ncbi:MAG TPA: hypothetical protein VGQ34_05210 [Sphingomicrobium sp.]|nr:hypothetical protein [Sphingomicrobium sp.]